MQHIIFMNKQSNNFSLGSSVIRILLTLDKLYTKLWIFGLQ